MSADPNTSGAPGGGDASSSAESVSLYDRMGGHETFTRLVAKFYEGVRTDPPLRDLYPEEDLGPAEGRLRLFLEQYWGGPTTYSEQRGHPRLRMRHTPFAVTPTQRDRWLHHMMAAVDSVELDEQMDSALREYLTRAAWSLLNSEEGQPAPAERM